MTVSKILICIALYACSISFATAQIIDIQKHADCEHPFTIKAVGTIGPTTAPKGAGDNLEFSDNQLGDQTFIEKEHNTVWYKFKAPTQADFVFQLEPLDSLDDYDFALYEYTNENFCAAVKNKTIQPLRTNFSRNKVEINSWTGLSFDALNDFEPAGIAPAYSKALPVKKGKEYVLLVDNVYNNGKGHLLHFNYTKNIRLKGLIRDKKSQQTLASSLTFSNVATQEVFKQIEVTENGTFMLDFSISLQQIKTPFLLTLNSPNYPQFTKQLDVSAILSLRGQPLICELEKLQKKALPLPKKQSREVTINGLVVEEKTNKKIKQARIVITDLQTGEIIAQTQSDKNTGKYELNVLKNAQQPIYIEISKEGYFFKDSILYPSNNYSQNNIEVVSELQKLKKGAEFIVRNILFYGNSPKVLPQSHPTIKALFRTLQQNKTLKIKIKGHTNGCGNGRGFSIRLSKRRTETIFDYLTKNGIQSARLQAEGFGCSQMLYNEYSTMNYLNRRVEIEVLDF